MYFTTIAQPNVTTLSMVSPREGDNLTITCTATGVPVSSVTWSRVDGSTPT